MTSTSKQLRAQDGVRLHLLRWGDSSRRALVLLHGGGANAHWWDHIAPALATNWHVVAPDLRGHGDSERPEQLSSAAFESDLHALLTELGARNPVIVGHSMGAAIALRYAAQQGNIGALILLDPARGSDTRSRRRLRLALTLGRGYASEEEAIERYRFVPESRYASEALRATIASHSVRRDHDGRHRYKFDPRWFTLPSRPRPEVGAISCPVLILRGADSNVLTAEGLERWQYDLPHAEVVQIDAAGHHLQLDQPDQTLGAIQAFLAAL